MTLQAVHLSTQHLDAYRLSAGDQAIDVLPPLAAPLAGCRILHLSATPYGGGVAEILRSFVPLLRDLRLVADWRIITGDNDYFQITKKIHNALQGGDQTLEEDEWEIYRQHARHTAKALDEDYDLVVVHDAQPLPAVNYLRHRMGARYVFRSHIDTSCPNTEVWRRLQRYFDDYDAAVFTLDQFVPPEFPTDLVEIIPPAIDPESPKNIELGRHLAYRILRWTGVDLARPIISQISRFDPWKDPLGVIEVFRQVKKEVQGLQLVLAGSMALDDPEGWDVYRQIEEEAAEDPDIHLFTNLNGVGNIEVNAFQRLSDVVIQKSIREGFGLVVSETLWKGTPVVAGRSGGIPLQLEGDCGGFLIDSTEECAERTLQLLRNPDEGELLARRGQQRVMERFLLTRYLADELRLYRRLLLDDAEDGDRLRPGDPGAGRQGPAQPV